MNRGQAPRVTILVLNWNGKADTLDCLDSLTRVSYEPRDIVVVDNGSNDDSPNAIAARFPTVKILPTGSNLGYAGGNNVGLRYILGTSADFVFVLNNDTVVPSNMLELLLHESTARQPPAVVGAMMLSTDPLRSVQFAGAAWDPDMYYFRWFHGETYLEPSQPETITTDYVQGSAVLIPVAAIREVGLFDERFFLTYEDTDWCYRARKHGYECLIATRAIVSHKESPSFGGKQSPLYVYFVTRNRLLWTQIHVGWRGVVQVLKRMYWMMRTDFLEYRRHLLNSAAQSKALFSSLSSFLHEPHQRAVLAGVRDYLLRRFGNCPPAIRRLKVRSSR